MEAFEKIVSPCCIGGSKKKYAEIVWDGRILSIKGLGHGGDEFSYEDFALGEPTEKWNVEMLMKFTNIWAEWRCHNNSHYCTHQKELGWDKLAEKKVEIYKYSLTADMCDKKSQLEDDTKQRLFNGESVKWTKEQIDLLQLETSLETHEKLKGDMLNKYELKDVETEFLFWLTPDKHPDGLRGKKCPVCGHRFHYGEYTFVDVPEDVLTWLYNLPDDEIDEDMCLI